MKKPRLFRIDALTVSLTGFRSFRELLEAKGGYFPSIQISKPGALRLADLYDQAQQTRGDTRRAYRN